MAKEIEKTAGGHLSPFERIKRTNDAGTEFWSSRQFAGVLGYGDYRNFEGVIEKAKLSCFNSGHRLEDHFVDVTEMVTIGSGAERAVKTVLLSRYACYLAIQNADPKKEIVAHGQTYFAIQTRRQELADEHIDEERRLLLREVMNTVGSTIHVNFNTSKTSRLTFAEFTEVYQIEADFKDRV